VLFLDSLKRDSILPSSLAVRNINIGLLLEAAISHFIFLPSAADKLASFASQLQSDHKIKATTYSADASKTADVIEVFKKIKADLGNPQVLVYNAAYFKIASVANSAPEDYEQAYNTIALGGIVSAKQVLPAMLEAKDGTIVRLFTSQTLL
jgi:short-subunit dehydrogenase